VVGNPDECCEIRGEKAADQPAQQAQIPRLRHDGLQFAVSRKDAVKLLQAQWDRVQGR